MKNIVRKESEIAREADTVTGGAAPKKRRNYGWIPITVIAAASVIYLIVMAL